MNQKELTERAASLDCLLKCLSAVDADNSEAVQALPQALKIASDYAEQIFEEIANRD